jgi:hypothetical protein
VRIDIAAPFIFIKFNFYTQAVFACERKPPVRQSKKAAILKLSKFHSMPLMNAA